MIKTHILTDMIKAAEQRVHEALHMVADAEEASAISRKDIYDSEADIKEIQDLLAQIDAKVSGPYDLAAYPGVIEVGHKALEEAQRKLRIHEETNRDRWNEVLHLRAERDLRMLELKLLKIADGEINH